MMKTFVSSEIARGGHEGLSVCRSSRRVLCVFQPWSALLALWGVYDELTTYLRAIDG